MKSKKYIVIYIIVLINFTVFAQYGKQKKADNLFNKFSFVDASEVYKDLIENDFNKDYSVRQLADSYAYMRNPDSAVVYYKKAVEQNNVPLEYYYKYAQALRGNKEYKESRIWLKKFKDAGGTIDNDKFLKDADFITTIFNAKPQYFLKDVKFNSKYSDFGAYVHDGLTYFTSSRDEGVSTKHIYGWNKEPFLDIYVKTENENDSIVDHKSKIKGKVNSTYHDGPLTITNDGKTMYFSRNNYNKAGLAKDKAGFSNLKIYKASLINGIWDNIEELPFNNDEYSTGHPSLNSDNTKLYFASDMPGGIGGSDIYYVDIKSDGTIGMPQNLGSIVNTVENEVFPFINNEDVLFFSSNGHHGLGLLDIFATIKDKNDIITSVLNVGIPVNSNKDDFSFFMNEAATRGGVVALSTGGSGAAMDQGAALVTYAAQPSGKVAVGLLVNDMVNIDLTRQHLNQYKDEVQKGGKVTLLQKGYVVTNNLEGTAPSAGNAAFLAHSGNLATSDTIADDTDTNGHGRIVGRFLSGVDEDGYAKVYIDLPNTNK